MYIFVLIFEYVDDFVSINAENICQKKNAPLILKSECCYY